MRWWGRDFGLAPSKEIRDHYPTATALHQKKYEVDDPPPTSLRPRFRTCRFWDVSQNRPQPAAEHSGKFERGAGRCRQFRKQRAFTMRKILWSDARWLKRHAWKRVYGQKRIPSSESRSLRLIDRFYNGFGPIAQLVRAPGLHPGSPGSSPSGTTYSNVQSGKTLIINIIGVLLFICPALHADEERWGMKVPVSFKGLWGACRMGCIFELYTHSSLSLQRFCIARVGSVFIIFA